MDIVKTVTLDPLGQCMYCGDSGVNLTAEHIVPRGMNGELLLPASSCDICKEIIGKEVETPFLKRGGPLADFRLVTGLRSYKPKRQPGDVKMTFVKADGSTFLKKVNKRQAAAVMSWPEFVRAQYLMAERPFQARDGMEVRAIQDALAGRSVAKLAKANGAVSVRFKIEIDPNVLNRLLCKIAYGWHVAERGLFPREESPALAVLMGCRKDYMSWVGSWEVDELSPHSNGWHQLSIHDLTTPMGTSCTVVHVSLFQKHRPVTQYEVVTRAKGWRSVALR